MHTNKPNLNTIYHFLIMVGLFCFFQLHHHDQLIWVHPTIYLLPLFRRCLCDLWKQNRIQKANLHLDLFTFPKLQSTACFLFWQSLTSRECTCTVSFLLRHTQLTSSSSSFHHTQFFFLSFLTNYNVVIFVHLFTIGCWALI